MQLEKREKQSEKTFLCTPNKEVWPCENESNRNTCHNRSSCVSQLASLISAFRHFSFVMWWINTLTRPDRNMLKDSPASSSIMNTLIFNKIIGICALPFDEYPNAKLSTYHTRLNSSTACFGTSVRVRLCSCVCSVCSVSGSASLRPPSHPSRSPTLL